MTKIIRTPRAVYRFTIPASACDATREIIRGLIRDLARRDEEMHANALDTPNHAYAAMVHRQNMADLRRYGVTVSP